MKDDLKSSMFEYYDERAPEFDDIYLGGGPASISDPEAYRKEVGILSGIIRQLCSGNLIDLGCGTAFWLPYYTQSCSRITLFDQSRKMLDQAQRRAAAAGAAERTTILAGDVLACDFGELRFDTVLMAFLISHLTSEQEAGIFGTLSALLNPDGRILILDSVWNDARSRTRQKEGAQKRNLADGREFQIYKKYFDQSDLSSMAAAHGLAAQVLHFGKVFFAATMRFEGRKRPAGDGRGGGV